MGKRGFKRWPLPGIRKDGQPWGKRGPKPKSGAPTVAAEKRRQYARAQRLKRYGLTPVSYAQLLVKQGGVCALCRKPPKKKRLAVDHDHATGRVRGLLCYHCNRFLVSTHTLETLHQTLGYLTAVAA